MPVLSPEQFLQQTQPVEGAALPNRELWISEAAGLTQFGAFIHELQPGTRSSIKHWHSDEDEMVYVLEGEVMVMEGDVPARLPAGSAAAFKAGVPVGHYLWNASDRVARCLVVGTRAQLDRITYPDHDRVCIRDRSQPDDVWTDLRGRSADSPY
jgi:uncharacterized cupin superfamily protein